MGSQIEFCAAKGPRQQEAEQRRFVQCGNDIVRQLAFGLDAFGGSLEEVGDTAGPSDPSLFVGMLDSCSIHLNFSPSQVEGVPRSNRQIYQLYVTGRAIGCQRLICRMRQQTHP